MISVFGGVKSIVGKGEKADYHHFPFSYNVFKRLLSQGHKNLENVVKG